MYLHQRVHMYLHQHMHMYFHQQVLHVDSENLKNKVNPNIYRRLLQIVIHLLTQHGCLLFQELLIRSQGSCKIFNHFVLHSGEYSGVPISRISWGNGNWLKKSGVRKIEGGMKSRFIYKVLFFDN